MKRQLRAWRKALTKEELAIIRPLEKEMSELRERLSLMSWRYRRIQNRATVRAGKGKPPNG